MLRRLARSLVGKERFDRLKGYQLQSRMHPRIAMAFARGAATSGLRHVDPTRPATWEFSGFSQNGEDGIIDCLCERLVEPNRYFIEIGASNGLENNTSWLAMARRYSGLMIDGDSSKIAESEQTFKRLNWSLEFACLMVTRQTVRDIERMALVRNPDVLSLDIDSTDYYIAEALLAAGFRPRIFIVEYNSVYGPERSVTIPYSDNFNRHRAHPTGYYYGVSVMGLRHLFDRHGYRFLTVEQNGLNAFFVDPAAFARGFIDAVKGTAYRENIVHRRESRGGWTGQFEQIRHLPLVEIGDDSRRAAAAS
jgi:hypothetical protein